MESPPGAETVIDGRSYLYFGGTGYLGLAGRPEVIEAARDALSRYGLHTATSRTGFGHSPPLLEVERRAAGFFETETSFYFTSGYVGNHILAQALADRADAVFLDEGAHYCVDEAARLAGKPISRFRHRDPADLARCLSRDLRAGQRPLVMTDGVSPVTGAVAPIPDYLNTLRDYVGATLIVDDAHGVGVLGRHGRGSLEWHGLGDAGVNENVRCAGVGLFMGTTLAKAMGGYGGIIPGGRAFVRAVQGASHYYDGASPPPASTAAATAKAIEIVQREPELRERLSANIVRLRAGLRALGLSVDDWPTPVVGLQVGDASNMCRIHEALRGAGILVPYLAAYSGVGSEGLLRCAVCASHTPEMIEALLTEIRQVL